MGTLRKPGAETSPRPSRRRSRGVRLPAVSTNDEATRQFVVAYATRELEWSDWVGVLMMTYRAKVTYQAHTVTGDQVILWPGLMDCE